MYTNIEQFSTGYQFPIDVAELQRIQLYETNRKLFEGEHDKVFKLWGRQDQCETQIAIIENFHRRLSTIWGDLLLGEPPKFVADGFADDSIEQETIDNIGDTDFIKTSYETCLDVSRYGTGVLKLRYDNGIIIENVQPQFWFPVVSLDNIKNTQAHVLAYTFTVNEQTGIFDKLSNAFTPVTYLRVEIHEKGKITNKLFRLDGGVITTEVDLHRMFPNISYVEDTGIDDFLVFPIHNLMTSDRAYGKDDYSDLDSIMQEIEVRLMQISRILDKHSDPNMAVPANSFEKDKNGNWIYKASGGKAFPVESKEDIIPQYVTWDGQLEAQYKELERLTNDLYILSDTCPTLFGDNGKTGVATSGSALKRLLQTPLAHVNRVRLSFDSVIKKLLLTAIKLNNQFVSQKINTDNFKVKIIWKDGIPEDPYEMAQTEQLRTGGKPTTSVRSAVRRLDGLDGKALDEEVSRIIEEANQETPVNFNTAQDNKAVDANVG